jgi:hypothetical protein
MRQVHPTEDLRDNVESAFADGRQLALRAQPVPELIAFTFLEVDQVRALGDFALIGVTLDKREADRTVDVLEDHRRARPEALEFGAQLVSQRDPWSRSSRERANPQGDSRPEQSGHPTLPAARSASNRSWLTAIENIKDRPFTHAAREPPRPRNGQEGATRVGTATTPQTAQRASIAPPPGLIPTISSAERSFRAEIKFRSTEGAV